MIQVIDKSDFGAYVKFSDNIPARDIDFHCMEAQHFDGYPIFPSAKISDNNLMLDIQLSVNQSPVTRPELMTFFNDYVKPYLVTAAYARFILWAGRNLTQYGVRVNVEDTSVEVSDKARGEMIKDIENKNNVYLARMNKRLKEVNCTFDSIVYEYDSNYNTRAKTRIHAI